MIKNKIDYVIMEVSSHGIKLGRIKNLNFKIAGFTNLTEEHMDFHGNMENYFETKKKLFEISEKIAINLDDHYGEIILSEFKDKQHLSYGIDKKADIVAKKLNLTNTSTNFDLIQSSNSKTRETCKVKTNLLGKFNTYNILLAISIVKLLGEELNSACKSLKNNISIPGRLEKIETNQNFSIYLDYAHTPDGILNILKTINEIKNKNDNNRVVTVFGCGGDRDKTKRSKMGLIAGKMSDISIITSDNPRSEDPMSIINDILVGVKESCGKYIIIENRKEAINYAIKNHKNNDIILILGKGHENYQILKNETIEFNEHKIIKDFLKNNK